MDASLLRRRFLVGLCVAAVTGGALCLWLGSWISDHVTHDTRERQQVLQLGMLAEVIERSAAAEELTLAAVDSFAEQHPDFTSIRVLVGGRTLLASTAPEDTGELAAPRRLSRDNKGDKALYDLGKELQQAVAANRSGEGPQKEEMVVAEEPDGTLRLALPLEIDGEVEGFVQTIVVPGEQLDSTPWTPALLLLIAPALLFLAISRFISRPLAAAGIAVLLFAAAFFISGSMVWRNVASQWDEQQQRFTDQVAVEQQLATDLLGEHGLALEQPPLDPSTWDTNAYRESLGLLDRSGQVVSERFEAVKDRIATAFQRLEVLLFIVTAAVLLLIGLGGAAWLRAAISRHRAAYTYVVPAMLGMLLLVFFPFLYGIGISFTNQNIYNVDKVLTDISNVYHLDKPLWELWVGVDNYGDILTDLEIAKEAEGDDADAEAVINYNNFYWTLGFTIVWTVANVTIGVTVGLFLALLLNTRGLRFRPLYRVMLILPWAVPNYITALIWRGMFHRQFGVINQVLQMFGAEPIAWFDGPLTSFCAVVATNGWLSFPFMMVISLGALQSIPADLYEAARVDGATRWQQFWSITLPSLKPALIPAIILSVVWTFNMFNIIYLVSAGQPAGATEILITDAYKIAFEQYRYGYAAAYSVVIFAILLVYGVFQNRVTKATEGI